MLVLSRKPQERIVIMADPPVIVTLMEIGRGATKARIGITTPIGVKVLREEHLTPAEWQEIERAANGETASHAGQAEG